MKRKIFLVLLYSICSLQCNIFAQLGGSCETYHTMLVDLPCDDRDYHLVFEDNFDQDHLDLTKWNVQTYGNIITDNHCEYNSADNITVSGGSCFLIAKKETVVRRVDPTKADNIIMADGVTNLRSFNYTSATINTRERFLYGKYEIRCRMPHGIGLWPAFWMFGGSVWNEIDVFDQYDENDDFATGIGHDYDGDLDCEGCAQAFHNIGDFSQWHTFTCIFEFDRIEIWIGNSLVRFLPRYRDDFGAPVFCSENVSFLSCDALKAWPTEDMNIILDLWVGNAQGPEVSPDASTPFPSFFEIDYVRYYRKTNICDDAEFYSTSDLKIDPNPFVSNHISGKKVILNGNITVPSNIHLDITAQEEIKFLSEFKSLSGSELVAITNYNPCQRSMSFSDPDLNSQKYIDENKMLGLKIDVLPNPNIGEFTISIESKINYSSSLYVVDISGRILHTQSITVQEGLTQIQISKPELPVGVYFIKVDGMDEPIKMIISK